MVPTIIAYLLNASEDAEHRVGKSCRVFGLAALHLRLYRPSIIVRLKSVSVSP